MAEWNDDTRRGGPRLGLAPPPAGIGSPAPGTGTVLLVEDDDATRRAVALLLLARRMRIVEAADLEAARTALDAGAVDLLLLDLQLGHEDGLALVPHARRATPACGIIAMSGMARERVAPRLAAAGILSFLAKPFGPEELDEALSAAWHPWQGRRGSADPLRG